MKSVLLQQIEAYMVDQEAHLQAAGLTPAQVKRAMEPIRAWYERTKEEVEG